MSRASRLRDLCPVRYTAHTPPAPPPPPPQVLPPCRRNASCRVELHKMKQHCFFSAGAFCTMVSFSVKCAAAALVLALLAAFACQRSDPQLITISCNAELDLKDVQSPVRIHTFPLACYRGHARAPARLNRHAAGHAGLRTVPLRRRSSFPAHWKFYRHKDQKRQRFRALEVICCFSSQSKSLVFPLQCHQRGTVGSGCTRSVDICIFSPNRSRAPALAHLAPSFAIRQRRHRSLKDH